MKKVIFLCVLILTSWSVRDAAAQPRDRRQNREKVDRVERFRQMRLIEELNLGEDDAIRFMAKQKEHEERMKALADDRNGILDDMAAKLDDSTAAPAVGKDIGRTLEQDRKIFEERRKYQDEMKAMLTERQFARLLLFERDFQRQVRNAMGQRIKKRSGKFDE